MFVQRREKHIYRIAHEEKCQKLCRFFNESAMSLSTRPSESLFTSELFYPKTLIIKVLFELI